MPKALDGFAARSFRHDMEGPTKIRKGFSTMEIIYSKKAQQFISLLRGNDAEKTQKMLEQLEEEGYKLKVNTEAFNECKGLRCLRIRSSERWIRIFYGFVDNKIVLLGGLFKKSNETPKRDKDIAYKLLMELKKK